MIRCQDTNLTLQSITHVCRQCQLAVLRVPKQVAVALNRADRAVFSGYNVPSRRADIAAVMRHKILLDGHLDVVFVTRRLFCV